MQGPDNADPLDALRFGWGSAYDIDRDKRGYWARRRDGLGNDIVCPDVDQLWAAICKDYTANPMPRDQSAPLED